MENFIDIFEPLIPIFKNEYFQIGSVTLLAFGLWRKWKNSPWRIIERSYKSTFLKAPDDFMQTTIGYENQSFWSNKSTALIWNLENSLYVRIPWPICYLQPCLLIPWEDVRAKEIKKRFHKTYVIYLTKVPNIGLIFGRKFNRILKKHLEIIPNKSLESDA
jgi:hypothetical protein